MSIRNWRYSAEAHDGDVVAGVIEAADEAAAVAKLHERRLKPLTLEAAKSARASLNALSSSKSDLSLNELAAFARRMRDLLAAGLPLAKALELAGDQASSERLRLFFGHLAAETRSGRPLSSALANGDVAAPAFTRALVRTGESIGALPAQFDVLAAHYEGAVKIRREIIAQLVYPAALLALIVLTMIFLSFIVLPQFAQIFESASAPPPVETRIALGIGAFIRSYILYAPIIVLGVVLVWRFMSVRYRAQLERLLLNTPAIGPLRRSYEIGRYCRALSTMLKGGMTLADAMPLANDTVSLSPMRDGLERTEASVRTGAKLSAALKRHVSPAKEVISFLEVGDETGTLGEMAAQAAHISEERVNSALKRFMALLSPVLTALMGLATAGVIAAVMSGVLSLNDAVY